MQKENSLQSFDKVLVVGGGMGGIRAALDLAEAGRKVVLVDKAVSIGGLMTQLDRTFPTNNCDLCTISPHLSESGRQEYIELLAMTKVVDFAGKEGEFTATLTTAPRYIDLEKCTACGQCLAKFPECVRFTPGLDHRAPTCMRYPQATPQAFSIDMEKCTDVQALVDVCPAGAILPDDAEIQRKIACGAVVLAPGADLFDPSHLDYFGYAALPDVVTSLEYERIMSASGPTDGRLVRPSDGKVPKRVAWIQCVGSRGLQKGAGSHCSSACCMFAIKEAVVTRERYPDDIDTTIFYMDMRTFGKDYELYRNRAKDQYKVRFVRSRPHSVVRKQGADALTIDYVTDGGKDQISEEFDMVVLSTGFSMGEETKNLAKVMDVALESHDFAQTAPFNPVETSKPGIYVAGMFESPKDIPETLVQAGAAAQMAALRLPAVDIQQDEEEEEAVPVRDVTGQPPKIGVFVCDCGINIGGVVDVDAVVACAKTLPNVAVSQKVGHGCSAESMKAIEKIILDQDLNRVVIGGCSPRTHEAKFQDLLQRTGLNRYLLEMANIRDQDTWVHADAPEKAAQKAQNLISMAVSSVAKARPLKENTLPMNKNVLVVGGGVAGMTSALSLANRGFKVYLAERDNALGGLSAKHRKTLEGSDVRAFVTDLVEKTEAHENIEVIKNAIIVDHDGMPGLFKTGMQVGPQLFYRQIEHGATILATGAVANRPDQFLLGRSKAVSTLMDLEETIYDTPEQVKAWSSLVFIQCVGSRCPDNPNCSRICCQGAVKNALAALEVNPELRVFVLYRDMRTYGFQEDYYLKAREKGVIFIRYEENAPPEVSPEGDGVSVSFYDQVLGMNLKVAADHLALSTGMKADEEAVEDLAMIFRLPRTDDGYFLEDHIKLRPVDLPVPGFFVAGTAHAPKNIRESVAQAMAAASRASALLARDVISLGAGVARVDADKCAACLVCVRACPFGIPFINADGHSEIDPAQCRGCGICASECPAKAIELNQFEDDRILAQLEGLFERKSA